MLFGNCCIPYHRCWQVNQGVSNLGVDALAGLWWPLVIHVEEVHPVHYPVVWYSASTRAVWKNLAFCTAGVQRVDKSDLAVTKAVRCIRELHRDVRQFIILVELWTIVQ